MIHVILGVVGCFMGVFGVLSNLYILVILLWNKKTRTSSEWILLHLSWCGFGASIFHLCLLTPSIFSQRFILASPALPLCGISGCSLLILQLVTICADRAIAIVYPLRYSQIATSQRIAAYFLLVWLTSTAVMISSLFFSSFQEVNLVPHRQLDEWATNSNLHYDTTKNSSLISPVRDEHFDNTLFTSISNITWAAEENFTTSTQLPTTFNNAGGLASQQQVSSRSGSSSFLVPSSINSQNPFVTKSDDQVESSHSHSHHTSSSIANNNSGQDMVVTIHTTSDERNNNDLEEDDDPLLPVHQSPLSLDKQLVYELRPVIGVCLPKAYGFSILVLVAPMAILLICDLAVLSIARRQSHRILLAMTMVTITAQATVTRSKGMAPAPPPGLFINNVPARSRACRAVAEDMTTMVILHSPILLMLITEMIFKKHAAPEYLMMLGSVSIFAMPCCNALLYGIRARPLRAAYKSYLRIRLTNTTLENEIQNRLSPVDGSPRPSSRARSFRSASPSPNSSPIHTPPRRLSTNDLRPPGNQLLLTSSPSQDNMGRKRNSKSYYEDDASVSSLSRKVRSFLHIPSFPSQMDMQEFWSGLWRPNRSPTIVITHEFKDQPFTAA